MLQFAIILFSFINILYASDLNYLQLHLLRDQHQIIKQSRGHSFLNLNSSKRFMALYNTLNEDNLERLNKEVDNAYQDPYKASINAGQVIKYKDTLFKLNISNALYLEVNNPVFPEADIFNIRTNGLWIQRNYKIKDWSFSTQISYLNRWYLEERYSLKDVITDNIQIELEEGKTYTPLYLDFHINKTFNEYKFNLITSGFDLFNSDRFDFYQVRTSLSRDYKKLTYGIAITPLYIGDYDSVNTLALLFNYRFSNHLELKSDLSNLEKTVGLNLNYNRFEINLNYEKIRRDMITENEIENAQMNLILFY
jgi:hypothetical protein